MSDFEDEVVEVVEEEDLEEGEITDTDSDIEIVMTNVKSKKLPKRYSLHENKVTKDKHKSNCKHAYHSNYKVRDKNKSPNSNGIHKKHKFSCLQHLKYSKGVESSNKNSPNSLDNRNFTKSAFKNFSSPPRPVLPKTSPSNKLELKIEDDEDNYSELLLAYKKCRQHIKSKKKSSHVEKKSSHSEPEPSSKILNKRSSSKSNKYYIPNERTSPLRNDAMLPFKENNSNTSKKNNSPVQKVPGPETVQAQTELETHTPIEEMEREEESEDEEELRRIALATFAQRTLAKQKATEKDNVNAINSPTHSLSNHSSIEIFSNVDSSNDNHNVVDMDLDEENFVEDIHNDLFVIDNNPASYEFNPYFYDESHANHSNSAAQNDLPPKQELSFSASFNQMNEEAEEAILRAEVIASMFKKKPAPSAIENDSPKVEDLVESHSPHDMFNQIPVISKGQLLRSSAVNINNSKHKSRPPSSIKDVVESLSHQDSFNKIPVHSNAQLLRSSKENINTVIAKLGPQLINSKKVPVAKPRNINATQNNFIITLTNDSSSEESDEDEISGSKQNDVSGIDALISNARLKSDIKANSANLNNVSCLSKAQQEEYQKLKSLLAEKEPMTILPQVVKEKIAAEHQNLNFLITKISLAKKKLDKEVLVFQSAEKEVIDKKKMYLSAKLKFQHLQEQLHAAKLNKTSTLKAWKLHEAKLANANSVVTKQKALIALLETEYNHRRLQFEQNSSSPLIQ